MKDEYDFSKAQRGRFYRANAEVRLPVYLDKEVQALLQERAQREDVDLADVVNEVLRRELALAKPLPR